MTLNPADSLGIGRLANHQARPLRHGTLWKRSSFESDVEMFTLARSMSSGISRREAMNSTIFGVGTGSPKVSSARRPSTGYDVSDAGRPWCGTSTTRLMVVGIGGVGVSAIRSNNALSMSRSERPVNWEQIDYFVRRSCATKKRFARKPKASVRFKVYACSFCGGWHLTSRYKKPRVQ